ncbi:MAG: hypothetical protein JOZ78_09225 [Chroococcidiopsidaceae cyanobacterium CP_BM_ER_R8_30]|nr:hypothetical protein [Chroococcidiopsidaceae cyanobacterium CP_BM_ER_R8_30]
MGCVGGKLLQLDKAVFDGLHCLPRQQYATYTTQSQGDRNAAYHAPIKVAHCFIKFF